MQQSEKPIAKELKEEVTEIINGAIRALEAGHSTTLARSQLKEVSRRLLELEFEFKGGCNW
jgi:hypothetical protein